MSLLQGAWYLFKTELKRSVVSVALVFGLIVFTLLMCTSTYINIFDAHHPTLNDSLHFLSDYLFLLTFGAIGVMVTFLYGGGFNRDILADRLAYYRSLPISSEQIVVAKIIAGIVSALVGLAIFFVGNIVGFLIFSDFQLSNLSYAYIVHAFLLYGIVIVLNNMFVIIDLSISYKLYTIITFVFIALVLAGTVGISVISENTNSLLLWAYTFSQSNPLLAIVISLVMILVTTNMTFKVTTKKLKKRNLG